jgi:phosphotransferase system  glucose/maltose/N-acetylglucosamine-specific IIC component
LGTLFKLIPPIPLLISASILLLTGELISDEVESDLEEDKLEPDMMTMIMVT